MGKHLNGKKFNAGLPQGPILEPLFPNLHKLFVWWNLIFGESHHSSQLFHIRMIRHNNWTMISIKLVKGLIHGKCVLTQIPQNNSNKWFFKGFVQMKIILSVTQTTVQKHIGLYLDQKLNCNTHVKGKLSKVYKGIAFLRNLSNKLPVLAQLLLQHIRRS